MTALTRSSMALGARFVGVVAAAVHPNRKEAEQLPLESDGHGDSAGNGRPTPASDRPRRRKRIRTFGTVLVGLGIALFLYAGTVLFWGDPATGLYARWKQHQLAGQLDQSFAAYAASGGPRVPTGEGGSQSPQQVAELERRAVAAAARDFAAGVKLGQPLGRITIRKIGINPVFVEGTRWAQDLSRGPGHYPETSLPGLGKTVAIAGHRTTFGAWFRHVDELKAGDEIVARLPYATFYYRVFGHKVVASNDWSVIRERGFDALVLSACHPLYSASHRWIVFAALYRVDPLKGTPYHVNMENQAGPLSS